MKTILFVIAIFIGIGIGGMIATYIFFGILTLLGMIFLIESVPLLKWIFYKTSSFFDVVIFVLTIIATMRLGVTIAASMTVAGLGFTALYRPYINYQKSKNKKS